MRGAADEGVDPTHKTETLAKVVLAVDTWRWAGLPFRLRSGKALAVARKEALITFKPPQKVPDGLSGYEQPDRLRIGFGPDRLHLDLNINGPGDPDEPLLAAWRSDRVPLLEYPAGSATLHDFAARRRPGEITYGHVTRAGPLRRPTMMPRWWSEARPTPTQPTVQRRRQNQKQSGTSPILPSRRGKTEGTPGQGSRGAGAACDLSSFGGGWAIGPDDDTGARAARRKSRCGRVSPDCANGRSWARPAHDRRFRWLCPVT